MCLACREQKEEEEEEDNAEDVDDELPDMEEEVRLCRCLCQIWHLRLCL